MRRCASSASTRRRRRGTVTSSRPARPRLTHQCLDCARRQRRRSILRWSIVVGDRSGPAGQPSCAARAQRTAGGSRTGSPVEIEQCERPDSDSLLSLVAVVPTGTRQRPQSAGGCGPTCHGGDASAGPGGIDVNAGVDGGPSGGGPGQSFVRGPGHDPCTYRSLSAHGLLAWHMSYSYQGNDDPPEPPPDQYYGDDPDARWALAHCPANAGRDVLVWWPVGGRPPASLIDALRQRARDAVPFPVLGQQRRPERRAGRPVHHAAADVALGRPVDVGSGAGRGLDPGDRHRHRRGDTTAPDLGSRYRRRPRRL